MKKILIPVIVSSLLAFGSFAEDKKAAPAEKPAKAEKGKKKGKGKEVTILGEIKCAHCDFKIGDKCAAVLKTEKKSADNESHLYFLKGKPAKTFAKENPKAKKVEASGLSRKSGEHFSLRVTKIVEKK